MDRGYGALILYNQANYRCSFYQSSLLIVRGIMVIGFINFNLRIMMQVAMRERSDLVAFSLDVQKQDCISAFAHPRQEVDSVMILKSEVVFEK